MRNVRDPRKKLAVAGALSRAALALPMRRPPGRPRTIEDAVALNVRVPAGTYERLAAEAITGGTSMGAIVREALEEWFDKGVSQKGKEG